MSRCWRASLSASDMSMDTRVVAEARRARDRAIATYSHFKVGAALLLPDGQIITGCNVENASYGLTMCGERMALQHQHTPETARRQCGGQIEIHAAARFESRFGVRIRHFRDDTE